jgi:hypothetical protein
MFSAELVEDGITVEEVTSDGFVLVGGGRTLFGSVVDACSLPCLLADLSVSVSTGGTIGLSAPLVSFDGSPADGEGIAATEPSGLTHHVSAVGHGVNGAKPPVHDNHGGEWADGFDAPATSGDGVDLPILCLSEFDGELYAGGLFDQAGTQSVNQIARWNGMEWSPLSEAGGEGVRWSVTPALSTVDALLVRGTRLEVGGSFDSAGASESRNIAAWTGTGWSPYPIGLNAGVRALATYQGQLHAGGVFVRRSYEGAGFSLRGVARWNGADWEPLDDTGGVGVRTVFANGSVLASAAFAGKLFVGGVFDSAGSRPAQNVAQWDGILQSWDAVGDGLDGTVRALTVFNGRLYAGGDFAASGGIVLNGLAVLVGGAWLPVSGGVEENGQLSVRSIHAFVDQTDPDREYLFVGGRFNTVLQTVNGGVVPISTMHVARWRPFPGSLDPFFSELDDGVGDGTVTSPIGGAGTGVSAIALYQGSVFVGGGFMPSNAGELDSQGLARWDFVAPTSLSLPVPVSEVPSEPPVADLRIVPNPTPGLCTLNYSLVRPASVEMRIFNVAGQLVRKLERAFDGSGAHSRQWDARDDEGNVVPAGAYFVRVSTEQGTLTTSRIVVTR